MTTRAEPVDGRTDGRPNAVAGERGRLIGLAYRLLGSVAEAEDAVHETYARWFAMPGGQREAIESPRGWLTKVATRVCLDMLGSARARRALGASATSANGYRSPSPNWRAGSPDRRATRPPTRPTGSPSTSRSTWPSSSSSTR